MGGLTNQTDRRIVKVKFHISTIFGRRNQFQQWMKREFGESPKRSRHCDCQQAA